MSGVLGEVSKGGAGGCGVSGLDITPVDHLPTPKLDASLVQLDRSNAIAPVSRFSPSPFGRSNKKNGSMVSHGCCPENVCTRCAILPTKPVVTTAGTYYVTWSKQCANTGFSRALYILLMS